MIHEVDVDYDGIFEIQAGLQSGETRGLSACWINELPFVRLATRMVWRIEASLAAARTIMRRLVAKRYRGPMACSKRLLALSCRRS